MSLLQINDFLLKMLEEHVNLDSEVVKASAEAQASGRLTPLIKVELWSKIQARRLSEGKEEMAVQFSPPRPTPVRCLPTIKHLVKPLLPNLTCNERNSLTIFCKINLTIYTYATTLLKLKQF